MKLKRLIEALGNPRIFNFHDFTVKGISSDSKSVRDGFIFIAIKGTKEDGHRFIGEALKKGAKAVISQIPQVKSLEFQHKKFGSRNNCSWIYVKNSRQALAQLAAHFYQHPARRMKVIGITGTNGKTTVSYLIEGLLREAGLETAVMGTINYRFKGKIIPARNTTPGPLDIQSLLAQMQAEKVGYCVMEVSSHALDQERVLGVDYSYAIFTNLTQDHLDYHLNMQEYFKAKAKLFKNLSPQAKAIVNIDDAYAGQILKLTRAKKITFGLNKKAQVSATNIRFDIHGTKFLALTPRGELALSTKLIGRHNVYNILAALSFGINEGLDADLMKSAIGKFKSAPGRLERIDCGQDFSVFVDYAHTDDALKNVLVTLRELSEGRIIVVFGCGGNRDRGKRPKMGRVVSELADLAIVTSDNPRDEEPQDIIADITRGMRRKNYKVILERQEAISASLKIARPQDIVLIAGKGHENYQIFKSRTIHFDDRQVTRECLKSAN
jgi:UDP-N-acetylmuramoyl-L-alanyl-D-glutamate--2,6-diaminopimelate ligase